MRGIGDILQCSAIPFPSYTRGFSNISFIYSFPKKLQVPNYSLFYVFRLSTVETELFRLVSVNYRLTSNWHGSFQIIYLFLQCFSWRFFSVRMYVWQTFRLHTSQSMLLLQFNSIQFNSIQFNTTQLNYFIWQNAPTAWEAETHSEYSIITIILKQNCAAETQVQMIQCWQQTLIQLMFKHTNRQTNLQFFTQCIPKQSCSIC